MVNWGDYSFKDFDLGGKKGIIDRSDVRKVQKKLGLDIKIFEGMNEEKFNEAVINMGARGSVSNAEESLPDREVEPPTQQPIRGEYLNTGECLPADTVETNKIAEAIKECVFAGGLKDAAPEPQRTLGYGFETEEEAIEEEKKLREKYSNVVRDGNSIQVHLNEDEYREYMKPKVKDEMREGFLNPQKPNMGLE